MQRGGALDDHAAIVIIARHLLADPFARHHVCAGRGDVVQQSNLAGLRFKVLGRPGADEAAVLFPVALDTFLLDQALDQGEGVRSVGQHAAGSVGGRIECFAGETLADIHPAADAAAAAGGGAEARLRSFQHDAVDAVFVQLQRRGQAAVTATDDDDADTGRHIRQVDGAGLVALPPIGLGLEIGMEHREPPAYAKRVAA